MDMALNALQQYAKKDNEDEKPKAAPTKEALVKLQDAEQEEQQSEFVD